MKLRREAYRHVPVDLKKEFLSIDDMLDIFASITWRNASLLVEVVRTNGWLECRRRDGSLRRGEQ